MSKEKVFLIVFALLILGVENIFAGGTIISNAKRIASGKIELELKTGKLTLIPFVYSLVNQILSRWRN